MRVRTAAIAIAISIAASTHGLAQDGIPRTGAQAGSTLQGQKPWSFLVPSTSEVVRDEVSTGSYQRRRNGHPSR